jgi:hypothetical protein
LTALDATIDLGIALRILIHFQEGRIAGSYQGGPRFKLLGGAAAPHWDRDLNGDWNGDWKRLE